jgi:hypothetical protein
LKAVQTILPNGTVGIEEFQGKIRLRLPRHIFGGKQKWISTGLQYTPENWKTAQSEAWLVTINSM